VAVLWRHSRWGRLAEVTELGREEGVAVKAGCVGVNAPRSCACASATEIRGGRGLMRRMGGGFRTRGREGEGEREREGERGRGGERYGVYIGQEQRACLIWVLSQLT
jgi:hypothetical protein